MFVATFSSSFFIYAAHFSKNFFENFLKFFCNFPQIQFVYVLCHFASSSFNANVIRLPNSGAKIIEDLGVVLTHDEWRGHNSGASWIHAWLEREAPFPEDSAMPCPTQSNRQLNPLWYLGERQNGAPQKQRTRSSHAQS